MKNLFLSLFMLACLMSAPVLAALSPTDTLKPTLNHLTSVLSDTALKGDAHKTERRAKIMDTIKEVFNFREMSHRVLGPTWNEIDAAEQDNFTSQMTKLLENIYIGRLEEYSGEEIHFVGERIKGNIAQVSTEIAYQGKPISLSYIMDQSSGHWMVYDISIEGVRLVRNYMEQFRSILHKDKYPGLIKMIEEKNREYAAGDGTK
ncbi:MAG: ABC transporter substrate-binding protein [Desulfobulbaceae bacterium]|jgi:phospholipid transport system substrate-binding protein|nr:ABC transporter substrate-binding protein [Desulfobulbaceae bacterium]